MPLHRFLQILFDNCNIFLFWFFLYFSWHILMRMRTPKEGSCDPIPPLELPHSLHAFHRVSEADELNMVKHHTINYIEDWSEDIGFVNICFFAINSRSLIARGTMQTSNTKCFVGFIEFSSWFQYSSLWIFKMMGGIAYFPRFVLF